MSTTEAPIVVVAFQTDGAHFVHTLPGEKEKLLLSLVFFGFGTLCLLFFGTVLMCDHGRIWFCHRRWHVRYRPMEPPV